MKQKALNHANTCDLTCVLERRQSLKLIDDTNCK